MTIGRQEGKIFHPRYWSRFWRSSGCNPAKYGNENFAKYGNDNCGKFGKYGKYGKYCNENRGKYGNANCGKYGKYGKYGSDNYGKYCENNMDKIYGNHGKIESDDKNTKIWQKVEFLPCSLPVLVVKVNLTMVRINNAISIRKSTGNDQIKLLLKLL